MEITGKLHALQEVKTFDSGFMVQEFYLDTTRYDAFTGQEYENYVKLQNLNEKLDLRKFKQGDIVKVGFYVNGRPYEKDGRKYFAENLNAHSIELIKRQEEITQQQPQSVPAPVEDDDDLPF